MVDRTKYIKIGNAMSRKWAKQKQIDRYLRDLKTAQCAKCIIGDVVKGKCSYCSNVITERKVK